MAAKQAKKAPNKAAPDWATILKTAGLVGVPWDKAQVEKVRAAYDQLGMAHWFAAKVGGKARAIELINLLPD